MPIAPSAIGIMIFAIITTQDTPRQKQRTGEENHPVPKIRVTAASQHTPGIHMVGRPTMDEHDKTMLREAYNGISAGVSDIVQYFKEVCDPRDATPGEVVEMMTAGALDDLETVRKSAIEFNARAKVCDLTPPGPGVIGDLKAALEKCLMRVRQKKIPEAVVIARDAVTKFQGPLIQYKKEVETLCNNNGISQDIETDEDDEDSDYSENDYHNESGNPFYLTADEEKDLPIPEFDDDDDQPYVR